MENLLNLPEVQSGVIPFVSTLVIALLLRPLGGVYSGLALAAGFYLSAYSMGLLAFVPLRGTGKVLLLGIVVTVIGLLADVITVKGRAWLLAVLAGIAALWLIWPVLSRQQGLVMAAMAVAAFIYIAWLTAWSEVLSNTPLAAATTAWVLGLSTAATVIFGASASLGQLAISLGVAAGAYCLLVIVLKLRIGLILLLPALIIAGAIGLSGVIFAEAPWYSLLCLAAIPLLALIPVPITWPSLAQAALLAVYTLPAGVLAAGLSWWQSTVDSAYY